MAEPENPNDIALAPTGPGMPPRNTARPGATPASLIGMSVGGKFVLREVVGSGGMGTVFRADQINLGRTVAVKVLKAELARSEEMVRRFHTEARAASRLNHPNTIAVIDFGQTSEGLLYLVMEFVRGRTLRDILREEHPLDVTRLLDLVRQLLDGLEEAHLNGVIHQDIKPDNVLVERLSSGRDLVKVTDFGIARLRGEEPVKGPDGDDLVSGTPEYMAPEQILGLPIDARADLYSVGILLFELLLCERPFGGDATEVMEAQLHVPPPLDMLRERAGEVPEPLVGIVERALAKRPEDRFASAREFREALEGIEAGRRLREGRCPGCGVPVETGALFCHACGRRLAEQAAEKASESAERIVVEWEEELTTKPTGRTPPWGRARPSPVPFPLPLVGRDELLERLEAHFSSRDGGRTAVLVGEPGSGRTRICEEVARRAAGADCRVLVCGPDPSGLAASWHPIRTAVAALLGVAPGASRETIEASLVAAGIGPREAPGLMSLLGEGGPASDLELAPRRRECFAAALRVLRGGAAWPATLLVFDDADRFDRPSRALLERLAEFDAGSSVHLLLVAAPGSGFEELEGPLVLEVGGLDEPAVRELVDAAGLSGVEVGALFDQTGGLPLHAEQLLRLRLDGGSVRPGGTLADVVDARIEALPPQARRALQAAALVGFEAPVALLRSLVRDAEGLGDDLALLAERGFLVEDPERGIVRLGHPLFRDVIESGTPADVRRELHAKLFVLLAESSAGEAVVGHHGFEAGERLGVVEALERAGQQAQRLFDDAGAAVHYRQAWEAARRDLLRGEETAATTLARLGARLGEALRYSGELAAAHGVLVETLDHVADAPALAARIHRLLGHITALGEGGRGGGLEHLRSAVAQALRAGDNQLICETYIDLCTLLEADGQGEAALEEAAEAVSVVTGGEGPYATCGPTWTWRLVMRLAELHLQRGAVPEALDHAAAALMQAERVGSRIGLARVNAFLGNVLRGGERSEESRRYREKAAALLRQLGDRRSIAELLLGLAEDDLVAGRVEAARARLLEALELAQEVEWHEGERQAAAMLRRLS